MVHWVNVRREQIARLNRQAREHLRQAAVAAQTGDRDEAAEQKSRAEACERRVQQLRAQDKRSRPWRGGRR